MPLLPKFLFLSKDRPLTVAFAVLNGILLLSATFIGILWVKDAENAEVELLQKPQEAVISVGKLENIEIPEPYPMSGMYLMLWGALTDALCMLAFVFGTFCRCGYVWLKSWATGLPLGPFHTYTRPYPDPNMDGAPCSFIILNTVSP